MVTGVINFLIFLFLISVMKNIGKLIISGCKKNVFYSNFYYGFVLMSSYIVYFADGLIFIKKRNE